MPMLFSYGTLQQENVQQSTFGRKLHGHRDQLVGYELTALKIDDEHVVALSGAASHPIARFTGHAEDRVDGMVFEISDVELQQADAYEVSAYRRVQGELVSGGRAWVYVDARFAPTKS
jgi:gamma-glutamylcyclotransferase (GGCT)/AIG2-like uncharacterized protein YtfP